LIPIQGVDGLMIVDDEKLRAFATLLRYCHVYVCVISHMCHVVMRMCVSCHICVMLRVCHVVHMYLSCRKYVGVVSHLTTKS